MIGCTTAGEIAGSTSQHAGVALMTFGGSAFTIRTGVAGDLGADSAMAGERVATALTPDGWRGAHHVVLLLSDGLSGDQQALVTGVYRVTGAAVPLVGGCAGDDLRMVGTHQLIGGPDGDHVVSDSVVGAWLGSEAPIGVGVEHGWTRIGAPMVITSVDGTRVLSLDDEPALDVYCRALPVPDAARNDPEAFTRFALSHPLGISRRSQDLVRFVTGADFEARALHLVAPIPPGGLAWVMTGDINSVLAATGRACDAAVGRLGGRPARGILAFDCIARRELLGSSTAGEVATIGERSGGAPVIGFYTYGEIARTRGISGFHNQTLVVLAVA
jgi:hypothetical protein